MSRRWCWKRSNSPTALEMAITLKQGEVVEYPYLWHWQQERGETGGRKDRPACLALILPKDGVTHVVLLAVTGTPPGKDRAAIAIPQIEARRGGLRHWKAGWVILDECNIDVAERSFHGDFARTPRGRFSEAFMAQVKEALKSAMEAKVLRRIDRV